MVNAASQVNPYAPPEFLRLGMDYYIAGRFAAKASLFSNTGSLFHHSIETFLKAQLSLSIPLKELWSKKKYGHDLNRLWAKFKTLFPADDLSPFDQIVSELNRFEEIRYPDDQKVVGVRATVTQIAWHLPPANAKNLNPGYNEYTLFVPLMDKLIVTILRVCKKNPQFLLCMLNNNRSAHDVLRHENREEAFWKEAE